MHIAHAIRLATGTCSTGIRLKAEVSLTGNELQMPAAMNGQALKELVQ